MQRKKIHMLVILGIALLTSICYMNTFDAPFVFDDVRGIVENHEIRDPGNFLDPDTLTEQRPLVDLTFALNYTFSGLEVSSFHAVNLALHIVTAVMVYFLSLLVISRLNQARDRHQGKVDPIIGMAALTALIFALHPLQTQAVTYIVQRYTSMAALFYILSVLFFVLARIEQSKDKPWIRCCPFFALALAAGMLAFLSKQNAASLPGAILMSEFMLFDKSWAGWKKKLYWVVPAVAVFIIFVFINVGVFSGQTQMGKLLEDVSALMQETRDISRWEYLLTQFQVIPIYLFMFLIPVGQNIDHMYPIASSFLNLYSIAGFLFISALIVSAILSIKRAPVIAFAIFWFFIAISVESSIIPISDAMFEHRMYLPAVGPAMLLAWILVLMGSKYARFSLIISLCILIFFGSATWLRNQVWQSKTEVWQDSVQKNPGNYRAHTSLGLALEESNQQDMALHHYRQALKLNPDYAYAHLNMGALLGEKGRLSEAEQHFRRANKELPDNPNILNNLGVLLANKGQMATALEMFQKAVEADEYFIKARLNLALGLINQQKHKQAKQELQIILKLDPEHKQALKLLNQISR